MLKIPVSQTTTGDGNATSNYSPLNYGSDQVTYSGGTGPVSITVYASNEKTPTNWAIIGSISLDTIPTTEIYGIIDRALELESEGVYYSVAGLFWSLAAFYILGRFGRQKNYFDQNGLYPQRLRAGLL